MHIEATELDFDSIVRLYISKARFIFLRSQGETGPPLPLGGASSSVYKGGVCNKIRSACSI